MFHKTSWNKFYRQLCWWIFAKISMFCYLHISAVPVLLFHFQLSNYFPWNWVLFNLWAFFRVLEYVYLLSKYFWSFTWITRNFGYNLYYFIFSSDPSNSSNSANISFLWTICSLLSLCPSIIFFISIKLLNHYCVI